MPEAYILLLSAFEIGKSNFSWCIAGTALSKVNVWLVASKLWQMSHKQQKQQNVLELRQQQCKEL